MLRINCPCCGPRDEIEFAYGGESHVERPGPAPDVSAEEWAEYLFAGRNPRGITFERWRHAYGCGLWFNIARDTLSHEIRASYAITDRKPDIR